MTLRQCYEFALIECNKLKAPVLLLEDYIYLFNKAIQQKINEIYNRYDINQQSSDDLRVLQTTATIIPKRKEDSMLNDNIWVVELPKDYLHLLNCVAEFEGNNSNFDRCGGMNKITIISNCQRMTADIQGGIINNYYMKPSHKKPYYYIINNNNPKDDVTNPEMDSEIENKQGSSEKEQYKRISNQSTVKLEIHIGDSNWTTTKVQVTYLKSPMYVTMTQEDLLEIDDNTQVLEFPDYICYEIINTYVKLLLENASDPRLQTNIPVNQTIAIPGNN